MSPDFSKASLIYISLLTELRIPGLPVATNIPLLTELSSSTLTELGRIDEVKMSNIDEIATEDAKQALAELQQRGVVGTNWHSHLAEVIPIIGKEREYEGWWEYRISYRKDSVEEGFFQMSFMLPPNSGGERVRERIKQEFRERKDSPHFEKE